MKKYKLHIGIAILGAFLSCKHAEIANSQMKPIEDKNKNSINNPKVEPTVESPKLIESEIEQPRIKKQNIPK